MWHKRDYYWKNEFMYISTHFLWTHLHVWVFLRTAEGEFIESFEKTKLNYNSIYLFIWVFLSRHKMKRNQTSTEMFFSFQMYPRVFSPVAALLMLFLLVLKTFLTLFSFSSFQVASTVQRELKLKFKHCERQKSSCVLDSVYKVFGCCSAQPK